MLKIMCMVHITPRSKEKINQNLLKTSLSVMVSVFVIGMYEFSTVSPLSFGIGSLGIGKADKSLQIVSSSGCEMISISSLVDVLGNSMSAFDHRTFSVDSSATLLGLTFFFF